MTIPMTEREIIARRMDQILKLLQERESLILFNQLPEDLQKQVRALPMIGPITSSGIEKIYNIYNRIDFTVYALRNPNLAIDGNNFVRINQSKPILNNSDEQPVLSAQPQQTTVPISVKRVQQPPTVNTAPIVPSSGTNIATESSPTLDFGPFDPRQKGQS